MSLRTNAHGLLTVLIRAGALWVTLSSAIQSLQKYLAVALGPSGHPDAWGGVFDYWVLPWLILVVLAGITWLFADKIARLALVSPGQPHFESDLSFEQWQAIFVTGIGVYWFSGGIMDAAFYASLLLQANRDATLHITPDQTAGVWATIFQLLVSAVLILRARGLVGLLKRMRGSDQL